MPVLLVALGCALALWQLAVLTNFKGYRDRHGGRTRRFQSRWMGASDTGSETSPKVDPLKLFVSALLFAAGLAMGVSGIVML